MARNKGLLYWLWIAEKFKGKDFTDKDYSYMDRMEKSMKTDADKSIMAWFDVLQRNNIQKEEYFVKEVLDSASYIYKRQGG